MRLDKVEQEALRYALEGFEGQVYLFGSRLDDDKRGGDIDILLIPKKRQNSLKLALKVQTRFFARCEERLDVIVFNNTPLCKEILKNAKALDI